jgi:chromosome partitioning protein
MAAPFDLKFPGCPVLLVTSTKGGTGKSSTVQTLAVTAMQAGRKVCVIDLDPSGQLTEWKKRRGNADIDVSPVPAHYLKDAIEIARKDGTNFIIIDTAGTRVNYATEAARQSDLVLIPARPSTKEMEKIGETLEQLTLAGNPPRFIVFNRVHHSASTKLEEPRRIAREGFKVMPLPFHFTDREPAYDAADDKGLGPQEIEPDGPTAREAAMVFRFICEFLKLGRSEGNADHDRARSEAGQAEQRTA